MWHALCILRRPNRSRHRWCGTVPMCRGLSKHFLNTAAVLQRNTGERGGAMRPGHAGETRDAEPHTPNVQ